MIPVARTNDLITTEHEDGLVLYDTLDHHAHSLNGVSTFVWLQSDGVNTIDDIATQLGAKLGRASEGAEMRALVLMAVNRLQESGLVKPFAKRSVAGGVPGAMSRRAAAARMGVGALLVGGVLPTVFSILTPEPAFAHSNNAVGVSGACTTTAVGGCTRNTCTGVCSFDGLICNCT